MFAYLLLAKPPYQDFYSIQEALGASKSSISTALNHLQEAGIVSYQTFSGDRKRYFKVNPESWLKTIEQRVLQIGILGGMIEGIIEIRQDSPENSFRQELQKMADFHTGLTTLIKQFIQEWHQK